MEFLESDWFEFVAPPVMLDERLKWAGSRVWSMNGNEW